MNIFNFPKFGNIHINKVSPIIAWHVGETLDWQIDICKMYDGIIINFYNFRNELIYQHQVELNGSTSYILHIDKELSDKFNSGIYPIEIVGYKYNNEEALFDTMLDKLNNYIEVL